ncbi:hypothetical protein DPSP01_009054 [Paraphaeosphaeria sporulosa]
MVYELVASDLDAHTLLSQTPTKAPPRLPSVATDESTDSFMYQDRTPSACFVSNVSWQPSCACKDDRLLGISVESGLQFVRRLPSTILQPKHSAYHAERRFGPFNLDTCTSHCLCSFQKW